MIENFVISALCTGFYFIIGYLIPKIIPISSAILKKKDQDDYEKQKTLYYSGFTSILNCILITILGKF